MIPINQFRKGLKIEIDGVPFQIVDFQHVSPGKGSAFTRTKMRNMLTQSMVERTFKSNDKVNKADTIDREMQYLYTDSEGHHFMNKEDYEQWALSDETLGEMKGYLQESVEVRVTFFEGKAIGVDFPNFVELKVVETDPAFKGDTVTGGSKPAKFSTGAIVHVPFHIQEGDVLKIDTRTGSYVEKVSR